MVPGNTNTSTQRAARRSGRASLKQLLRRPLVQLCLLGTAVVQVTAVADAAHRSEGARRLALLAPVQVQPRVERVSALWARKATVAEGNRLAQKYRLEGYSVSSDLAETITEAALENGIDLDIAFGLVRAESSFRNTATSPVGAVGLTQLMPATARWLRPGTTTADLRQPEVNMRIGFRYLRELIDKYDGDQELALLAYNRGPGTVDRVLKRGGDPNNGYVEAVVTGEGVH